MKQFVNKCRKQLTSEIFVKLYSYEGIFPGIVVEGQIKVPVFTFLCNDLAITEFKSRQFPKIGCNLTKSLCI